MKTLEERALSKIDATGICWMWTDKPDPLGYGRLNVQGKPLLAHRLVWQLLVGEIPDGLTLDHLCRVRLCVNPDHLEAVPLAENKKRGASQNAVNARKTHCKRGHPFSPENTIIRPGRRECRSCHYADNRSRYRSKRGATTQERK